MLLRSDAEKCPSSIRLCRCSASLRNMPPIRFRNWSLHLQTPMRQTTAGTVKLWVLPRQSRGTPRNARRPAHRRSRRDPGLIPAWMSGVARQSFKQKIFQIPTSVDNRTDHHGVFSDPIHDAIGFDDKFPPHPGTCRCQFWNDASSLRRTSQRVGSRSQPDQEPARVRRRVPGNERDDFNQVVGRGFGPDHPPLAPSHLFRLGVSQPRRG